MVLWEGTGELAVWPALQNDLSLSWENLQEAIHLEEVNVWF